MKRHIPAAALLAALNAHAACDWSQPGADRYTGTAEAAIRAFADIPPDVQTALIRKHAARQWTARVDIRRDSIKGDDGAEYVGLRDMHFGSAGKVCAQVDRSKWGDDMVRGGLVYCAYETCVIQPADCSNWARVDRIAPHISVVEPEAPVSAGGGGVAIGPLPEPPAAAPLVPVVTATPTIVVRTFERVAYPDWAPPSYSAGPIYIRVPHIREPRPGPITAPVPEPETWALMLAGMVGVVVMAKRRKA